MAATVQTGEIKNKRAELQLNKKKAFSIFSLLPKKIHNDDDFAINQLRLFLRQTIAEKKKSFVCDEN